jgi:outer membrane autotransporter protein
MTKRLGSGLLSLAILASSSYAGEYKWTFADNTSFTNGSVSGSFTYDKDASIVSNVNVTLVLSGTTYTVDKAGLINNYLRLVSENSTSGYGIYVSATGLDGSNLTMNGVDFGAGNCISVINGLCTNINRTYTDNVTLNGSPVAQFLSNVQTLGKSHLLGLGNTLDNYSGSDTDILAFKTALGNYSGNALVKKMEQSLPMATANAVGVSTSLNSSMSGVVSARQGGNKGTNSGDMQFSDQNFWIKPFGSKANQNDKNGVSGFDATSKGMAIGIDGEYTEGKRAGLAFFLHR